MDHWRHAPALAAAVLAAVTCAPAARADELPLIEHQPSPCTLPGEPFRLCAKVSDDVGVGRARVYFRRAGDRHYAFTDMVFDGLGYCATLPAPRAGRTRLIEYHVQALDSAYQVQRTSVFQLQVKPARECEFAPVEQDAARRAKITVYATDAKQGRKLGDGFVDTSVVFVPVAR